ncbi:MAG: GNAT family N-acetyltransferase [Victivallales bacterium]|nr:GNAT family N-acetyltransferase [Victivallales bacterium]
MKPEIRLVRRVRREEFVRLYIDGGWWDDAYYSDTSFIDDIVTGSTLFAAAFKDSKMIGMGRAISDGCSDAYIQDVVVLKRHRGKGIGNSIIRFLLSELGKRGIDWIGLVAEPESAKFYQSLGFHKMRGHTPMCFVPEVSGQNSRRQ